MMYHHKIKISFYELIVLSVASFFTIIWFNGDFIVNPGDLNYSVNPVQDLYRSLFYWDRFQQLGVSDPMSIAKAIPYNLILYVMECLSLSLARSQQILFFALVFVSGISCLSFLKSINQETSPLFLIAGTLNYIFNTFLLQYRWGSGYIMGMFIYSTLPLMCLYFSRFVLYGGAKNIVFFLIAILLALPSLNNPTYIAPFILYAIWFYVYQLFVVKYDKLVISINSALIFLVATIVFFYYITSVFESFNATIASVNMSSDKYNQLLIASSDSSISNIMRGLGDWAFFQNHNGTLYNSYSPIYASPIFIIISFLIPALAIVSIILDSKPKGLMIANFFLGLYLIVIFLMKGVHPPFGEFYAKTLGLIRMPSEKFGALFPLINSYFIVYGLDVISRKRTFLTKSMLGLFSIAIIIAISFPFYNGTVWREGDSNLQGFKFRIPDYLYSIKNYLANDNLDSRVLELPPTNISIPGTGSYLFDNKLYNGPDPFGRLSPKPVVYLTSFVFNSPSSSFISSLSSEFQNVESIDLKRFLLSISKFNIRYVLVRSDLPTPNEQKYSEKFNILLGSLGAPIAFGDGKANLYKIPDDYFVPLVSAWYFDDRDSFSEFGRSNYIEKISGIPSEILEYRRIDPTRVIVKIKNVRSGKLHLRFAEDYAAGWVMRAKLSKIQAVESDALDRYKAQIIRTENNPDLISTTQLTSYTANTNVCNYCLTLPNYNTGSIYDVGPIQRSQYISMKFAGAFQNENINTISYRDYWQMHTIQQLSHNNDATYTNDWEVDLDRLRISEGFHYTPNAPDELVVLLEYTPQRNLYISIAITMGIILFFIIFIYYKRKVKRHGSDS